MLLNLFSACQQPSTDLPLPSKEGFYVKASSRLPQATESTTTLVRTKSNKSIKRSRSEKRKSVTSVTIGMPTGFRHEFHLGRDVGSMEELWDLDRWRVEIESRVAEAAAQHAAANAAAAQAELEADVKRRKPRPGSMVKRKAVPAIVPDEAQVPIPPLPAMQITLETVGKVDESAERVKEIQSDSDATSTRSSSSLGTGTESDSEATTNSLSDHLHSDQEHDASSDASSLPPATPSESPRHSRDLSRTLPASAIAPLVEIASADHSRSNSPVDDPVKLPWPSMPVSVSQPPTPSPLQTEFRDAQTAAPPPPTAAPTAQSPHSELLSALGCT